MKTLPALLLLLTFTQAIGVCKHEVQRTTDPNFDSYADNDDNVGHAFGSPLARFRFIKCMHEHGMDVHVDQVDRESEE